MLTSVDTAHRIIHESNCNTHKVESSSPEDVSSWSRFYDGGLLENQGRISGEGTKWLPTGENTRCTHWPSPLARVHSRRRAPNSNSIPSIRVRACVPERTPSQPRTVGKEKFKESSKEKTGTSAWKSEEQLGLFARQRPRCFSGENGFVCGVVRPTVQRTRSEGGLPCKHCKDSKTQSAISDLKQESLRRKNKMSSKDKSRYYGDDTIALLDSRQNTTVCLVRNDEICANANHSSCSNNNNNNNNNNNRENMTFLRDNSNALISIAGVGGMEERQQHQSWEMQPLGEDKVFVPLLLQDLEDFEAISDMDSITSETSFRVDNSAKKTTVDGDRQFTSGMRISSPAKYKPPDTKLPWGNQVVLEEEMLEEYIRLERLIQALERRRVLQRLEVKVDELRTLADEVHELEERQKSLTQRLEGKKGGEVNIRNKKENNKRKKQYEDEWSLQNRIIKDEKILRRLEKVIQKDESAQDESDLQYALEIVTKEVTKRRKKLKTLVREVNDLNAQAAHLLDLYLRLDQHLADLFSSSSASQDLRRLEAELSESERKQHQLEMAAARWQESQMLLEFACRQMSEAVQQWKDLPSVPTINVEVKYTLDDYSKPPNAYKVNKKIQDVEFGELPPNFPLATAENLRKLNEVPLETFADMLEPMGLLEEHHQPYSETYLRALILMHWFDQVLNTSMQRDLTEVSAEVRRTAQALRKERLHLVRKKIHRLHGKDPFPIDSGMDSDTEDEVRMGFENLFIKHPLQNGRLSELDESFRFDSLHDDKYDLKGDLAKLQANSYKMRAQTANSLRHKLDQRRMRRGLESGQKALRAAVTALQKIT